MVFNRWVLAWFYFKHGLTQRFDLPKRINQHVLMVWNPGVMLVDDGSELGPQRLLGYAMVTACS